MRFLILVLTIAFFPSLQALEKNAWFGVDHELETSFAWKHERFQRMHAEDKGLKNLRIDRSMMLNFLLPVMGKYQFEIEGGLAKRSVDYNFQNLSISLRKSIYNDLVGDPFSFVTGFNFHFVPSRSLTEPLLFYHSRFAGELTASLGKEWAKGRYWQWRASAHLALAQANRGCPRLNFLLSLEKNFSDQHFLSFSIDGVSGLGSTKLQREEDFRSYRNLSYSALDAAITYRFDYDLALKVDLEYRKRFYARYCAESYDAFLVRMIMPFSL